MTLLALDHHHHHRRRRRLRLRTYMHEKELRLSSWERLEKLVTLFPWTVVNGHSCSYYSFGTSALSPFTASSQSQNGEFFKSPHDQKISIEIHFLYIFVHNRGIFVYNICLISIRNSVSDGTTNKSVLNIERSQYDWLCQHVLNVFVQHAFKNSKCYKECMSSLALLPPRNFAVFEKQKLIEYYTQELKISPCTKLY